MDILLQFTIFLIFDINALLLGFIINPHPVGSNYVKFCFSKNLEKLSNFELKI
jgi:hypothetical protein